MDDWTEKYRPKSLDEIVGNEKALIQLRKWASQWTDKKPKQKAVILSGKAGTGKTSSAIALANDFGWATIELNTSDARNAEKIRNVATYGAENETFSDEGEFLNSKKGKRKLIILDEADNLYERANISGISERDLSDRGGKKAIIDTIKKTNQPIILIVNNYYGLIKGTGDILKHICKLIRFYDPYPNQVQDLLKKICNNEGITIDPVSLKSITDRCKGDIRSALNDLQSICMNRKYIDPKDIEVIGYRDREKDIFTVLREIFKTKNIKVIRESVTHLDLDPKMLLLWLNENLPKEYIDRTDLLNAYEVVSKADIFLGRTQKKQNYRLWSYASDIMNGGIAVAKTHSYPNDNYTFPTWLREKKDIKIKNEIKRLIIKKISTYCHLSSKKTKEQILNYFTTMFRNNTYFAIKMKNNFNLSEAEVEYLLGKKSSHKIKEIMLTSKLANIRPLTEEEFEKDDENKQKIQQSLFDY
jgi:replication factor C large subunit